MDNITNKPLVQNLFIAFLALLVVFMAGKSISELKGLKYIGEGLNATNVITVNGTGDVLATPDVATFSFSVTQEAAAVPDAQKKATDKMNAILAYVKKAGIADKDVKTLSYNIYPRYEYINQPNVAPYYGQGKQVLAAYVVSQTVEVKVRKMDDAGTLLSGVGSLGATDVSGLNFSVDKQTDVDRQARDKAIADAREQANVLARSLGVSLGRIVSFSESGSARYPIYYAKDAMMGAGSVAPQAANVPSGENKVTSNVTITYEIK